MFELELFMNQNEKCVYLENEKSLYSWRRTWTALVFYTLKATWIVKYIEIDIKISISRYIFCSYCFCTLKFKNLTTDGMMLNN